MRTLPRLALAGWLGLVTTQAHAQEPRTTWTVSASARESNELSRVFNDVPQQDQILDNADVGLQLATRTERARLALFGRVGANVYREGKTQPNGINYGGGFTWAFDPSLRLSTGLSANVSRDFRAETLTDLGVLVPNVSSKAASAAWNLSYRTSPRTTVTTSLTYNFTQFETEGAIAPSQLVLDASPFQDVFEPLPDKRLPPTLTAPDAEDAVLRILATEGLAVRETTTHWANATFGVARRLTQYTTLGVDLGGGYRTIDAATTVVQQDGAEGAGRLWVERSLGPSTTLQSSYTLRRSLALDPSTTIQMAMGGFSYAPAARSINIAAQAGASYYQAGGKSLLTPSVDASFGTSLTRSTRLALSYQRQFQQSLGFGRTLLLDFANISLSQEFGSRVTFTALAGASLGRDPLVEDSRYDAYRIGGTLTVRILEPLSAGTTFTSLETRERLEGADTSSSRDLWTFFVRFSKSWN